MQDMLYVLFFILIFRKELINLDYVITNSKVYIRLNNNGTPETCSKQNAQRFENSKARNILEHLPKTMKKFHFKVEAIPEEIVHKKENDNKEEIISNEVITGTYTVSESVMQWLERVKNCNELAKDAAERKAELIKELSNVDRELSNCLHRIELTKWRNVCVGYKDYKSVKLILEKRRKIKDELSVVQSILSLNLESMAFNQIEKVVKRLENRTFTVREVENYDDL